MNCKTKAAIALALLLVAAILLVRKGSPRQLITTSPDQNAHSNSIEANDGRESAPPITNQIAPQIERPPGNPPASVAGLYPAPQQGQEEAFRDFIRKMGQYSELLHTEFRLREQLAAFHPHESAHTNQFVFQEMRLVFEELGRKASTNGHALRLLVEASRSPYLQGVAIAGLGKAAEGGNEKARTLLTHPEENGWLISGVAGALVNVARAHDEEAIQFMYNLTVDPQKKALWWFATQGLSPAADAGSELAISGLINMVGSAPTFIRDSIVSTLKTAAENGSTTAAAAFNEFSSPADARAKP